MVKSKTAQVSKKVLEIFRKVVWLKFLIIQNSNNIGIFQKIRYQFVKNANIGIFVLIVGLF